MEIESNGCNNVMQCDKKAHFVVFFPRKVESVKCTVSQLQVVDTHIISLFCMLYYSPFVIRLSKMVRVPLLLQQSILSLSHSFK